MIEEADIREALVTALTPLGLVVEEVSVGEARLDLALFSDEFHGYEIKSDRDNLSRLYYQIKTYTKYCGTVTVVAGPKYAEKIMDKIPSWVGVVLASGSPVTLKTLRVSRPNTGRCLRSYWRLLWVKELRAAIKATGAKGYSRLCHNSLANMAEKHHRESTAAILETLKKRDWKWWK